MTVQPLVLAVDDEAPMLRLIKMELSSKGFRVVTASTADDALHIAEQQRPDVAILDLMMPDISGLELMRRLRERTQVPVLLLTGMARDEDKIKGLEMGADDYLVKPFNPNELTARVRAILRRSISPGTGNGEGTTVRAGNVEIDLSKRIVKRNGEAVTLTRTEWMLLQHLAMNAGRVMLNAELLTRVWGPEYTDDLQYLRVWVSRLRSKLEEEPAKPIIIKTMPGLGYILDEHEEIPASVEATDAPSKELQPA